MSVSRRHKIEAHATVQQAAFSRLQTRRIEHSPCQSTRLGVSDVMLFHSYDRHDPHVDVGQKHFVSIEQIVNVDRLFADLRQLCGQMSVARRASCA